MASSKWNPSIGTTMDEFSGSTSCRLAASVDLPDPGGPAIATTKRRALAARLNMAAAMVAISDMASGPGSNLLLSSCRQLTKSSNSSRGLGRRYLCLVFHPGLTYELLRRSSPPSRFSSMIARLRTAFHLQLLPLAIGFVLLAAISRLALLADRDAAGGKRRRSHRVRTGQPTGYRAVARPGCRNGPARLSPDRRRSLSPTLPLGRGCIACGNGRHRRDHGSGLGAAGAVRSASLGHQRKIRGNR